ncbi:DsbE family thiol:disulfide interchange protein [Legionella sp. km772]|uniref:DsbE family thiol:disulfide interchange protein n=1 Tax=Legionella sp. km772 TaxID=2498111 RepID=UPI000F8C71B1|nr:DsbE family thiol:disulfide interchange protein [Legionella sp. km772]RUR13293.1 DsbE family thiol:disulfide interchange protein [Legionella sp. km772]
MKISWKGIPIVVFIVICIFLWRGLSLDPHRLPSVQVGKPLPVFSLPQLAQPGVLFQSSQLRGRVVLLNVWASWCAACVDEQVFLMQLAREGVAIYGLNYKDNSHDALQWLQQWGNPYKLIASDAQGKAAIDLGVYGAPETFVIDKKGVIRYRHAGIMNQELWQKEMQPLIKELEQQA